MADNYDPLPDLALLLDAALRAGWNALPYVDRLVERLSLEPSGGPEAAERLLREALGLPPRACELVSERHGTPCPQPAVTLLARTCACDPGHLTERWVCEGHREPEGPLWCRACYRLPAPEDHKCPVGLLPAEVTP